MAELLDSDQEIVEKDLATGGLKATEYFEDYLFRIIEGLGGEGSANILSLIKSTDRIRARLSDLENRIGSGDPLTSDDTGFTVDTDKLSVDQDEA